MENKKFLALVCIYRIVSFFMDASLTHTKEFLLEDFYWKLDMHLLTYQM